MSARKPSGRMREGDVRTDHVPGVLRVRATKLKKWVRVMFWRLDDNSLQSDSFEAADGMTLIGLTSGEGVGFYLPRHAQWFFTEKREEVTVSEETYRRLLFAIGELREAMQKRELKAVYAGTASTDFWARVSELKEEEREAAYSMGCMLQDLEGRVLRFINKRTGV